MEVDEHFAETCESICDKNVDEVDPCLFEGVESLGGKPPQLVEEAVGGKGTATNEEGPVADKEDSGEVKQLEVARGKIEAEAHNEGR